MSNLEFKNPFQSQQSRTGSGKIIMPDGQSSPLHEVLDSSSFSAATQSSNRGFIVFPELDTRKEIGAYNRTAILTKGRWFYNNTGFGKRIVRGIARMVGFMVPKPVTPDPEWNAMIKKAWRMATGSASAFDVSGKYNASSYQLNLNRLFLKDGDSLTVFANSDDASRVRCYEGHQIQNPIGDALATSTLRQGAKQWLDGVRVGKNNDSQAYFVRNPDDRAKGTVFSSSACHLYTQYERPGQPRGVGCFSHAANAMLDLQEMKNDVTLGVKTSNLIGFYLSRKMPDAPSLPGGRGMAADLKKRRLTDRLDDGSEGEDDDPSNDEYVDFEEVMNSGQIPKWDGWEPGVLHDARPNENHLELWRWLVREISLGLDFPPEVLWQLGADMNGNVVRVLGEDAQETIDMMRMELLIPFMQRLWFHVVGGMIARGEIRQPKVPKGQENFTGWWSVEWIPPRRKTIDRSKEGKLNLDERRAMLRTMDHHFSELQLDWSEESDQWMSEIETILDRAETRGWSEERIRMLEVSLLAPAAGVPIPAEALEKPSASDNGNDADDDDDE